MRSDGRALVGAAREAAVAAGCRRRKCGGGDEDELYLKEGRRKSFAII